MIIFLTKTEILLLVPGLRYWGNCSVASETFYNQAAALCMIHIHFIALCFHQEKYIPRKDETPESWI